MGDLLICPDCKGETTPDEQDKQFLTHVCAHCGYIIMQSEWNIKAKFNTNFIHATPNR
jgi:NMD protein affecting ribosome stability and mRNA decay